MISRRAVLGGGLASLGTMSAPAPAAASRPPWGDAPLTVRRRLGDPFTLGVASGDPEPGGVVLWMRLAPHPLAPDGLGGMPAREVLVDWRVAEDPQLTRVVRSGRARALPRLAHSVHVEVEGLPA